MTHATRILTACFAAALLATVARAEIYRTVDKDGRVIYTDRPSDGAQTVEVGPTNTMQEMAPRPAEEPAADAPQDTGPAGYERIAITEPASGATVSNAAGNILVRYALRPALRKGDRVRLLVNGQPTGAPAEGGLLASGMARGEHSLTIQVLDPSGMVLGTSAPVGVTLVRPPPRPAPVPRVMPH